MLPSTISALIFIYRNDSLIDSIHYNSNNEHHLVYRRIHLASTEIPQSISVVNKSIYKAIKRILFFTIFGELNFIQPDEFSHVLACIEYKF